MTAPTYQELETRLQDLYEGKKIVIPCDIDHAYNMLKVAGAYIQDDKQRMWQYLKGNAQ